MTKKNQVVHWAGDLKSISEVKVGEFVDLGAGCFNKLTESGWIQIDGGYSLQITDGYAQECIDARG